MSKAEHIAHSAGRVALRQQAALRVVTAAEEGRSIDRQPQGVYGFTNSPSSDEVPLFILPTFQCFEVHKPAGGDFAFIGYLKETEAALFLAGREPAPVDLYPEPYGEATHLVSIRVSRILLRKPVTRDRGNSMRIELLPEPEHM
jgi:hypothetical protein